MNILAISDRPPEHSIKETIENNSIDLIMCLGDLEYSYLSELEKINIPKIGVYGNHCNPGYFEKLGIINMHMHTFEYRNLIFGGIEGCVRYKEDKYSKMYTQAEATQMMQNFPYVDVLISHSPSYGINDDQSDIAHTGFEAIRKYIEEKHPEHFFHGHTYPSSEVLVSEYMGTHIHYIFADKIIQI